MKSPVEHPSNFACFVSSNIKENKIRAHLATGKTKQLPLTVMGAVLHAEEQGTEQAGGCILTAVKSHLQSIPTPGKLQ